MDVFISVLMTVSFAVMLRALNVSQLCRQVLQASVEASRRLADSEMNDATKQIVARSTAITLFKYSGLIVLKTTLAILVPAALSTSAVLLKVVDPERLEAAFKNWIVLLLGCLSAVLVLSFRGPRV